MVYPPRPTKLETPDLSGTVHRRYPNRPFSFIRRPSLGKLWSQLQDEFAWHMFIQRAEFEDDPEDETWIPHRYLGAGTYGRVGLWCKRAADGARKDEIAIKEVHKKPDTWWPSELWAADEPGRALTREAVIQTQLNKLQCENIVHLRGYKHYSAHNDHTKTPTYKHRFWIVNAHGLKVEDKRHQAVWRFKDLLLYRHYFEYCPYMTLEGLRTKYRFWNRHFPEAFLWHVFNSLAEAAACHDTFPQDGLPPHPLVAKDARLVHVDIKSENIFLGYREHREDAKIHGGTKKYDYPSIKLGDHGMTQVTWADDPWNPRKMFRKGTPGKQPPEIIHYGVEWGPLYAPNPYPLDTWNALFQPNMKHMIDRKSGSMTHPTRRLRLDTMDNRGIQIDSKLHVWAIGKVMYELMTLGDNQEYWNLVTEDAQNFQDWNGRPIENYDTLPFQQGFVPNQSPYSAQLSALIEQCMNPSIADRIGLESLIAATKVHVDHFDSIWTVDCESNYSYDAPNHPKLFYRNNDILEMPEGRHNHNFEYRHYVRMQDLHKTDPDWGEFKPAFQRRNSMQQRADQFWVGFKQGTDTQSYQRNQLTMHEDAIWMKATWQAETAERAAQDAHTSTLDRDDGGATTRRVEIETGNELRTKNDDVAEAQNQKEKSENMVDRHSSQSQPTRSSLESTTPSRDEYHSKPDGKPGKRVGSDAQEREPKRRREGPKRARAQAQATATATAVLPFRTSEAEECERNPEIANVGDQHAANAGDKQESMTKPVDLVPSPPASAARGYLLAYSLAAKGKIPNLPDRLMVDHRDPTFHWDEQGNQYVRTVNGVNQWYDRSNGKTAVWRPIQYTCTGHPKLKGG